MERKRDRQLAEAMIAGEPEAFHRFLAIYQRKVFQFSLLVCRHRDDAEEIAQETLLNVFLQFHQLRDPDSLRAWVFRIAKNACFLRRRRRIRHGSEEIPVDDVPSCQLVDRGEKPESAAMRSQLNHLLHRAIGSLPEAYRTVLLLRDWEGLSGAETAQVLGISEELVRTRLSRARYAVRRKVAPICAGI